jgi:predicted nucleic acid-binding protein
LGKNSRSEIKYKGLRGERILVDTNILIYQLNGKADFTEDLLSAKSMSISAMTVSELFAGTPRAQLNDLKDYLNDFKIIPVSEEIATLAGALKSTIPNYGLKDLIIAATVQVHKLKLFTANKKDFKGLTTIKAVFAEVE